MKEYVKSEANRIKEIVMTDANSEYKKELNRVLAKRRWEEQRQRDQQKNEELKKKG